ncbi:MAG: patatin-like phospholipase family protein [Bacteroidales bacterium]|nr:patatin-like phospholipase family protein [Bacteroidales bacterium]
MTPSVIEAQKVGLVLSGGGAKGLAHVGLLKALEQNNIPIDYVAGTSMGAIVAGLYAAGYSTDDMDRLFRSPEFASWYTGFMPEENRYYFLQSDDNPAWVKFHLVKQDEKLKLRLPTSLVPEEQMDFAFMQMFSAANAVCDNDFNKLFVPFLCMATDVYNNKALELREGDLGEAIRASMTFPFVFKPIVIKGALAFDGGMLNNFPTQQAINAFHPDVIIGHKVANNPRKPDEDDLIGQMENMFMKQTNYELESQQGLLIETRFSNVSLLDFPKIDFIEQSGYNNAVTMMDSIKKLVRRRVSASELAERRQAFNDRKPPMLFQKINVEGVTDSLQRSYIVQSIKRYSDVVTLDEFRNNYFKLIADPQIKSMRPVAYFNRETGYFDLLLKVKHQEPLEVKIGGTLSTKPITQGYAGATYRYFDDRAYAFDANVFFGRFYSSAQVGGRIDFPEKLPFFVAGHVTFNRWDYYAASSGLLFEDVSPPYIIRYESNYKAEIGIPTGSKGKLTGAAAYGIARDRYYVAETATKSDELNRTSLKTFSGKVRFERNSLDYCQFATEGVYSFAEFIMVSGREEYRPGTDIGDALAPYKGHKGFYVSRARASRYFNIAKQFTVGVMGEGVYSNMRPLSNHRSTLLWLPAFEPIPFSATLFLPEYRAAKYTAGGVKLLLNLTNDIHFRTEIYAFTPIELVKQKDMFRTQFIYDPLKEVKFMGMCGLVGHTGFGPVSLTINYFNRAEAKIHIMAGFGFTLFNKRAY